MVSSEKPLWKALAQAVSGQEIDLENYNDDEIIRLARQHGVDHLLYSQITMGSISGVSDVLKDELKSSLYPQVASDLLLNTATQKLLELLAANEIPALLLKGTPVAHLYYPHTYLRPRCDTDIYISEDHLEEIADLLTSHGYELSGLGARKYSSRQFVAAISTFQQSRVHFDMHWKLSNRMMFRGTLPFEECLRSSQPVADLGINAHTLSTPDLMIHACIHRIAHGRNTERNRLIWLYDIHLIAEAMNDTGLDHFLHRAEQKVVAMLCADALETCRAVFNTTLPENFLARLKSDCQHEPSAKLIDASKLRWAWQDMQSLDSTPEKIAFARELLFD